VTSFLLPLLRTGIALLALAATGWAMAGKFVPPGPRFHAERIGWSYALGCGLLIAFVPSSLLIGARPNWIGFVVLAALAIGLSRSLAPLTLPSPPAGGRGEMPLGNPAHFEPPLPAGEGRGEGSPTRVLLLLLILLGVAIYALRALTEPMWANDFIAIWGLKGKTIFGAVGYPERLRSLEFAHPEYPLGLPLLYAGISFLTGRWDDHAMALIFPLFQVATLLVLFGWLRRRGVSAAVAGLSAATVAWFEPLYSGFLTGMAEVPLSFGILLFGAALVDALDDSDGGALRRLAFAAALIAALKNEGLFLAVAGALLALIFGRGRRWKVALSAFGPALLVRALHLPWRSRIPVADLDPGLFSAERLWDSLAAAAMLPGWPAWAGLGLLLTLIALGDRVPAGKRLLLLVACAAAAYVVIPAFAVRGPAWLIETTLLRTTAALAPLAAAAVAVRFPGR